MSSAWGQSFGASFGDSWGALGDVAVTQPVAVAGWPKRRYERVAIQLEGETLVFESIEDLYDYLESQKVELEKKAEKKAERQAKRILRTGKVTKPQPLKLVLPTALVAAEPRLALILEDIDRAFRDALQAVFAREAEDEEDLAIVMSLL